MILKTDLKDCFPSISSGKVYKMFTRDQHCSPDVARHLTRLTTLSGSLPQGAPTSTILANLVSKRLVLRLNGLVAKPGGRASSYVDDIVISGPPAVARMRTSAIRTIRQEGFVVNLAKTETKSSDQEQVLTGIRIDHRLDVPSEKVKAVRKQIECLPVKITEGDPMVQSEIKSIQGKIRYVARLNKGAAHALHKRLQKAINARQS